MCGATLNCSHSLIVVDSKGNWSIGSAACQWDGSDGHVGSVVIDLGESGETAIIGAATLPLSGYKEEKSVGIDGQKLTKGEVRKLNALRKSVGDALGEEVFGKWLAKQGLTEVESDPVVAKIEEALAGFSDDKTFRLGNYGYSIRRARGKGVSGFVVTKNEKPKK